MTEFNEISIGDKALFDRYLQQYPQETSEMTFTNLFMWRHFYKFRFAEIHGTLCVISVPGEGLPYALMPIGDRTGAAFSKVFSELKAYFEDKGWTLEFRRVWENDLSSFEDLAPEDAAAPDRDNSDYVYASTDLIHLAGKRFDGKRNHINKFKKLYSFEYVPLEEQHLEECRRITEEWCAEHSCEDDDHLHCEKEANMELLNNFSALGCKGALIKVDGKFCAFTVGEMLNANTAVIHVEKAVSHINGLYTFINQQFCTHAWQDAEFINREQDLGAEGLRKAKLSYNPVKLISKYTIRVKQHA